MSTGGEIRRVLVVSGGPRVMEAARRDWPDGDVRHCDSHGRRRRLARLVENFDPDVVVDGSRGADRSLSWLRDKRGFDVPVLRYEHGEDVPPVPADGLVSSGSWPVRREDVLFVYTDRGSVAQQLGVIMELDPLPDGVSVTAEQVRGVLAERADEMATLRRKRVDRGPFRRPGWTMVDKIEAADHVDEVVVSDEAEVAEVVNAYWSERLPVDRPQWGILLVRGLPGGASVAAMKMHHALADGLSAIGNLKRILDLGESPQERSARKRSETPGANARLVIRGLWRHATSGFAPRSRLNGRIEDLRRVVATASVPSERLRATAKALGKPPSTLAVSAVVEGLSRVVAGSGEERMRLMVPISLRSIAEARTYGNWTATLTADVPVTPMTPAERMRAVEEALTESGTNGQPAGAAFALRALGFLPPPLHRVICRAVYSERFFNTVVSYVPAVRERRLLAGAPIRMVYPVMGLASGVRLAIAVMPWADTTGVCVIADRALAADARALANGVRDALEEYAALAELPPAP